MKALKCDRCGRYYEKNVLVKSKGSVIGSVIGGIYTRTKDGKADEPFDLCDDCIKSLFEWMKEPNSDSMWIPVSDRNPDSAREVLVSIKIIQFGMTKHVIDKAQLLCSETTDRKVWNCDNYGIIGESARNCIVTAWMELPKPKPYKEDTQDE